MNMLGLFVTMPLRARLRERSSTTSCYKKNLTKCVKTSQGCIPYDSVPRSQVSGYWWKPHVYVAHERVTRTTRTTRDSIIRSICVFYLMHYIYTSARCALFIPRENVVPLKAQMFSTFFNLRSSANRFTTACLTIPAFVLPLTKGAVPLPLYLSIEWIFGHRASCQQLTHSMVSVIR